MSFRGIDVSYAQGAVDWKKVKASGIEFAFIRACFGWDNDNQIDRYYAQNVSGASQAGVPFGLYHYSYATSPEEAKKEAQFFLRVIAGQKPEYPVAFDLEDKSQANLGKETLTAIAIAFLSEVAAAGYYPILYANKDWLTNKLDMSKLLAYDVWLAQYNSEATYKGSFGIWQYSSTGKVDGIAGNVDLNTSYKDYPLLIKAAGKNGWKGTANSMSKYVGEKAQRLILPINKSVVTANYKNTLYQKQFGFVHYGMDFISTENKTVYACGEGEVVACGQDGTTLTGSTARMGNCIVIVYKDVLCNDGSIRSLACRMYHFNSIAVKAGQKVTRDTVIGQYGSTGANTTGAHLHIEFDTDVKYPAYAYGIRASGFVIKKGTEDSTFNPSKIWFLDGNQSIKGATPGWYGEGDVNLPTIASQQPIDQLLGTIK